MYVDNLTDRRQGIDGIYNVDPLVTSFYVPDEYDYPDRVATLVRAGILKISDGLEKNGLPNGFPEAKPEVVAKEEPVELAEEVVEDGGDNTESTATESKPKSTARRGAKK